MLEDIFGKYENFKYRERKPTNKLVEGAGINDSPFVVQPIIGGKKECHPAYLVWKNMLRRCYAHKYKEKYPTYTNASCCKEWLLFTNFAKWFKEHYITGYHLDKDILIKGNKLYSPETCIFVTQEINNFLLTNYKIRGNLPLGVHLNNGKFQADQKVAGKYTYLGLFWTKEEAHRAWQKAKLEQAIAFNFPPLQRVIDQLTYEIENNLETISL